MRPQELESTGHGLSVMWGYLRLNVSHYKITLALFQIITVLPLFLSVSVGCLCDPTTGGRRTQWRGSPAVWTTPALMQTTLWRRLSRVRTSRIAAAMKVGQPFKMSGSHFITGAYHNADFFPQTATWGCLSAKTGAQPWAGPSMPAGSPQASTAHSASVTASVSFDLCFCVSPGELPGHLNPWSLRRTDPYTRQRTNHLGIFDCVCAYTYKKRLLFNTLYTI